MEVLPEPEPEAELEVEEAEGVGKGVSLDSMRETSNRMKGGSPQRWDYCKGHSIVNHQMDKSKCMVDTSKQMGLP
jgi:hypothetical protein